MRSRELAVKVKRVWSLESMAALGSRELLMLKFSMLHLLGRKLQGVPVAEEQLDAVTKEVPFYRWF